MAQSYAVGGSIQQTLQQNVDAEPVPLKRKKRGSGAPAGKSVVVLKRSNVTIRNDSVFMPNTIEMAQVKKKENGQFLTNVQISSEMSEQDIEELLISSFSCLGDQRLSCASAVDNRTRLDFHGEPRIWDGRQIKQKIKGNSALYIYTDEGSLGKQDSTSSKQSTLKRSHDQMTPTMQGECRIDKGGDVSIMTQGGILAQSGMTQNIVSTASQSQSRKPTMHIVDGQAEGRNTIPSKSSLLPHTNLQGMVSSSLLTHQLNILNITSAASEQERGQLGQTAGGYDLTQGGITCNSTAQSKPGSVVSAEIDQCAGKRGSVSNAAGAHQEEAGTSESDFESRSSDSALERPSDSGIEGSDNLFVDDKSSGTGFEPVSTGISVPGNLENTVEILEPDDKKDLPSDGGPSTASMVNDTSMLDLASEEISFSEELAYIPDVGTSVFGGVQDIFPSCGSVKGGFEFRISLNEALPDQFKSGWAWFDKVGFVPVNKLNPFTLSGTVPRSEVTGDVLVGVLTDSFQELGNTLFKYIDDAENTLKQFIQDPALQAKYFTMLAGNLANGIPTFGSHFAQALGPMNVLQNGSSIQANQEQSVELLQLMVYTAAQTGAQRFIEMVFSTSAGQVVFNSYKERNSLPEDVARANGHEELAQYLQDVHTRLSLDKNVHSTVIDWLELVEAVKKQSLTTQDESLIGLDRSDEDDDDSSDYFADAETSSCGSCDDDPGWPEMSEKKESCVHDGISSEVQITSENNDLSTTCSTKASFTENERTIKGGSTKGQTTRDDICFVVKQGSSCLDKGRETGEYSDLSSSLSCVADLHEMSCEVLNNEDSISKVTCSTKGSFTENERIIKGESTKGQTTRDDICFVVKQGSSCLDKGRGTGEYSELSSSLSCVADLLEMSCEDLNNENSISKGPCIHGEISNEVQSIGECDDLSRTSSSKALFTKNERIITGESTKGQITRDEISFVVKQSSSCLDQGEEREISELSKPQRITSLPELFVMSCEDLGEDNLNFSTSRNNMAKEPKEPCIQEVTSNEERPVEIIVSWCDDRSMTSSKASFTKNEKIVEVESTKRQTTSEDRAFAMKQGSSCLKIGRHRIGFPERRSPQLISRILQSVYRVLCKEINIGDFISTASEINNERVTEEESSQRQSTRENIVFDMAKQSLFLPPAFSKRRLISHLLNTQEISTKIYSPLTLDEDRPANEPLRDAVSAISDPKTKGVWKCLASEFRVSEMTRIDLEVNKWKLRYWSIERETLFSHLKLLMKEHHLLEREQLFAMERLLSQKLSTKTKQLLSVRLMKRVRKFQGTYEVSGDPVCKSVNSYEGEPREVALAILFELFLDPVAAQTSLESTVLVRNSKINQTDRENQQVDKNDCKALKLCKAGRGAQVTSEAVQASLHVNDVQLEDLAVGFRRVLQTKPLESNLRKTDEITVETLFDLSCDLREEWKYLAFALGVGDAKNDRVDERNKTFREKCYNMLLLWKQRFGPQATYKALEVGLCHDSVQREDLVKKYCHDIISSAMQ